MRSQDIPAEAERVEDQIIIHCARAQLDPERAERVRRLLREQIDWTYLVTTAIRHGTSALLYWHLRSISLESVPCSWRTLLADHFHATAARNLYLTGALLSLLDLFASKGILAIPYKGPVLSILAYQNLALRPYVDLDLFIRQHNVPEAFRLLLAEGYCPNDDLPRSEGELTTRIPGEYLFHRDGGKVIVELHTEYTPRYFPVKFDLEDAALRLRPVRLSGKEVLTFSLEDLIPILCLHASKHFWDRLVWICDIAELARQHGGVNWEGAEEQARRLGCERMFLLGICLASDILAASFPDRLVRQVKSNPAVRSLAQLVRGRLLRGDRVALGVAQRALFRLRMRESLLDGARYCLRMATTPTEEDWSYFRLPSALTPLYPLLRPFRLVSKYGLGLMRRLEPDLAPFVPTPDDVVERMLALGEVRPSDVLYDLGCGDGRILIAAAKTFGARGVGFDIEPRRIAEAQAHARRQGVSNLVRFVCQDAKTADLSEATVVTLYLTLAGNIKLRDMLQGKLRDGARVVSRDFDMGDWRPEKTEVVESSTGITATLLLWRIGASGDGFGPAESSRRRDLTPPDARFA